MKTLRKIWCALIAVTALLFGAILLPVASAEGPDDSYTIPEDSAKRIFGTSDRPGREGIDAFRVEADPESGKRYMPAFSDAPTQVGETERQALNEAEVARTSIADSMEVTVSRYSQNAVEVALDKVTNEARENEWAIAFNYSPKLDAIHVSTDEETAARMPPSYGGVELMFETGSPIVIFWGSTTTGMLARSMVP